MIEILIPHEELQDYTEVDDAELNELFQDVRAISPIFYLRPLSFEVDAGLFKRPKKVLHYTMYIDHRSQIQVFNFAPTNSDQGSINTSATKGDVMNFFFGFLSGHRAAFLKIKEEKKQSGK